MSEPIVVHPDQIHELGLKAPRCPERDCPARMKGKVARHYTHYFWGCLRWPKCEGYRPLPEIVPPAPGAVLFPITSNNQEHLVDQESDGELDELEDDEEEQDIIECPACGHCW